MLWKICQKRHALQQLPVTAPTKKCKSDKSYCDDCDVKPKTQKRKRPKKRSRRQRKKRRNKIAAGIAGDNDEKTR